MADRLLTIDRFLIGVLLVIALALVLHGPEAALWIDVGSPRDERFTQDMHQPERNPSESYRWTMTESSLSVPVRWDRQYDVELALAVVESEDRVLTLTCGDEERQIDLASRLGNFSERIPCDARDSRIEIALSAPTVRYEGDGRALGVALRDIKISPAALTPRFALAVQTVLVVGSVLGGLILLVGIVRPRLRLVVATGAGLVWLIAAWLRPEAAQTLVVLPPALAFFGVSVAARSIHRGRYRAAFIAGLLTVIALIVLEPLDLALITPGLWTQADLDAARLLIWLAPLGALVGAVLGGTRAIWPAVVGAGSALAAMGLPLLPLAGDNPLEFQITVPDWTADASVAGLLMVTFIIGIAPTGVIASTRSMLRPALSMLVVASAVVAPLLAWRIAVMDFNGDEPHYYVTARSIGADQDLELLDDYHNPEYRASTVSPDGNVAVVRDSGANRYAAFSPPAPDGWYLIPQDALGWEIDRDPGLIPNERQAPELAGPDGSRATLPQLTAAQEQTLIFPAGCRVDSVWLAATSTDSTNATLELRESDGTSIWEDRVDLGSGTQAVAIPSEYSACPDSEPMALQINSEDDLVAMGYDRDFRSSFIGSAGAGPAIFGGLPRDRYASQDIETRIYAYNAGQTDATLDLRFTGASGHAASERRVLIGTGETVTVSSVVPGAGGLFVESESEDGDVIVFGTGRVQDHEYALPWAVTADDWSFSVDRSPDRDAGVWLSLVNSGDAPAVAVVDSGASTEYEICAGCAETVLVAPRADQTVLVEADLEVLASAVEYEERTGSLHFDLGLPLLVAIFAWIGPPWLTLVVPALAGVLIAPALWELLRDLEVGETWATIGVVSGVVAAPMSTFSVRLYTEIIAACLILIGLLVWNRARTQPIFHLSVLAVAGALPVLHARMLPIAATFIVLSVVSIITTPSIQCRVRRIPKRWGVLIIAGTVGILLLALLSAPIVGLESRDIGGYFQFRWVPVNVVGMFLDRGSGLLPVAPWILLGFFVGRRLSPVQIAALILILVNFGVIALRAGSWMTWGPPGRYLLPVVPLVLLFAIPGAERLWSNRPGKMAIGIAASWSLLVTTILHWVPLAGYIAWPRYLIDETWRAMIGWSPAVIFPRVEPAFGGTGYQVLGALVIATVALYCLTLLLLLLRISRRSVERTS